MRREPGTHLGPWRAGLREVGPRPGLRGLCARVFWSVEPEGLHLRLVPWASESKVGRGGGSDTSREETPGLTASLCPTSLQSLLGLLAP